MNEKQKMIIIKRDFVPRDSLSICNRALPSGRAYFLEDANNQIYYASEDYIYQHYTYVERGGVRDYTKGLISTFEQSGGGGGNHPNAINNSINKDVENKEFAIMYLELTQEKMPNFTGYRDKINNFLPLLYQYYKKEGYLSPAQINKTLKIEIDQRSYIGKDGCRVLSFKNLQTCYAYEFKIKYAIDELSEEKKSYLQSLLQYLYGNLYFSDEQIKAIEKWFENLSKSLKETKLAAFDK